MLGSPGPSAILGRAVALPGDAGRIGIRIVCRPSFLDHDRMFPVIAEVVGVGKAGDAGFEQAVQPQAILVGDIIDGAPIAILPAVNVKRMKVPAVPAHSRLDCLMQVTECHATEHQDPAPDWWLRAAQRHFQTNHTGIAYPFHSDRLRHDTRTLPFWYRSL